LSLASSGKSQLKVGFRRKLDCGGLCAFGFVPTTLVDEVWGYNNYPTTRTVDNHIASLRLKLEKNPGLPVGEIMTIAIAPRRLDIFARHI
jgi:hypothetical protein